MRPVFVLGLAACFACGPASDGPGPASPAVSNTAPETAPAEPVEPAPPLEQAQRVVEEFFEAFGNGDVDAMLDACEMPFFLDGDRIETREALHTEFAKAAEKIKSRGGIEILSMSAVSDWRAYAEDYPGPETDLTVFVVRGRVEGMGDETMRVFVKMGDDPVLIAIGD